ncbi:MAG: hypothetical protein HRU21_07640, partial [Pseudomonadales bacterium]|nr:hypothetical protein [Pseudomonadales bacterium]
MIIFLRSKRCQALILLTVLLTLGGCVLKTSGSTDNGEPEDGDDGRDQNTNIDINISTSAYPILQEANALHRFNQRDFQLDQAQPANPSNESIIVFFDNLLPAQTSDILDDDQDPSLNDLAIARTNWTEQRDNLRWVNIDNFSNDPDSP